MDHPDDTTRRTTFAPSFDVNEDDVNEDALFDAPPEPDDTTELHDAHPLEEPNALPSTPSQGEFIESPQTLPQSTLSLEDRVAQFTDLFGGIKEELKDTQEDLRNAQAQAAVHEAQLTHFVKKEAQQDVDHQDVLSRLAQAQAELAMMQPDGSSPQVTRVSGHHNAPRMSMYAGKSHSEPVPKILTSGDAITKMPKFAGLPSSNIVEHLLDFESAARNYAPAFLMDLALLTLDPKVLKETTRHGRTLVPNRDNTSCGRDWRDYAELKTWLLSRYTRPQHDIERLSEVFWPAPHRLGTEAYLNHLDAQLASLRTLFDDDTKKALALHHLDPRVV